MVGDYSKFSCYKLYKLGTGVVLVEVDGLINLHSLTKHIKEERVGKERGRDYS